MTMLNFKQVLEDNNVRDPNSITSLTLTHKALADISCLGEFKNLEKLDLSFNNLSSLEGLKSCDNLKWLSVSQNKLQSLKGIEGLTKLIVLNAGKNNLRSMDEVNSLVSLRALILNDNKIISICRLDRLKELNTLVLSRNPICKIGKALFKVISITKLSLSNCGVEAIDSSLKSCTELKELRLAHNNIKALPVELAYNSKIQNLDLGNNSIASWSDLKVLSSLINVRNLNLQGNLIVENDKLVKKIKKLMPKLRIFNGRPIYTVDKKENGGMTVKEIDKSTHNVSNKLSVQKGEEKHYGKGDKNLKHQGASESKDSSVDFGSLEIDELKIKKRKANIFSAEKSLNQEESAHNIENKINKKLKMQKNRDRANAEHETPNVDPDGQNKLNYKEKHTYEFQREKASEHRKNSTLTKRESKKKSKAVTKPDIGVIDDGETPLAELFAANSVENAESNEKMIDSKIIQDEDITAALVTVPKNSKDIKGSGRGPSVFEQFSLAVDIGLGGVSTWDDS